MKKNNDTVIKKTYPDIIKLWEKIVQKTNYNIFLIIKYYNVVKEKLWYKKTKQLLLFLEKKYNKIVIYKRYHLTAKWVSICLESNEFSSNSKLSV